MNWLSGACASPRRAQSGSALAIALIFLLLMSIIGISSMRDTTLQERMTGNQRDRNLAFQAAEAALRAGEDWLGVVGNPATVDANSPLTDPANWDGVTPAPTGSVAGFDSQIPTDPVFYICQSRKARIGIELPPDYRDIYPVTARGAGGTNDAVVVLETMFAPPK